eukprot:UN24713
MFILIILVLLIYVICVNFFILQPGFERQFCLYPHESLPGFHYKYYFKFRLFDGLTQNNVLETTFRWLTCYFRSVPNFFLLGPKKTGSTTLANHFMTLGFKGPFPLWNSYWGPGKESNFFSGFLGLASYFSSHTAFKLHFPFKSARDPKIIYFDADPSLFSSTSRTRPNICNEPKNEIYRHGA